MSKSDRKVTKVEITFEEMIKLSDAFKQLKAENPVIENSRFGVHFTNFADQFITPVFEKYNKKLRNIAIDNALVDEKTKEILFSDDRKDYKYSKDGLKAKIEDQEKLDEEWNPKKFTVEKMCLKDKMPKMSARIESVFMKIVDLSA